MSAQDSHLSGGLLAAAGRDRTARAGRDVRAHVEAHEAGKLAVSLSRQLPSRCGRRPRWRAGAATPAGHHVENHALEMMAGPVMGITVTGKSASRAAVDLGQAPRIGWLRASIDGGTAEEPAFGYMLDNGATTRRRRRRTCPGPTLVLKRGEPVSITVVNQLPGTDRSALARHRARELLRRRGWLFRRREADRAGHSARRLLRSALHAAALGHVHLSHAHRRSPAACRPGFRARCSSWTSRRRTIRSTISCCW